jgi:hypothetical protein
MAKPKDAILPETENRTAAGTTIVLMSSVVAIFGLFSLFLTHYHEWNDRLALGVPWPGVATSFAADPGLATQVRVSEVTVKMTKLADQTQALIAQVRLTNDALIPIRNVVVEAILIQDGEDGRKASALCGKNISSRILGRMPRSELTALMRMRPRESVELETGASTTCQVALIGTEEELEEIDEVELRVASVEPRPGHRLSRFRSPE